MTNSKATVVSKRRDRDACTYEIITLCIKKKYERTSEIMKAKIYVRHYNKEDRVYDYIEPAACPQPYR